MARLAHRPAADCSPMPIFKVEVIAHIWWESRYPGTSVITADQMHVPAGRRLIDLTLKTGDAPDLLASPAVVHGFYLPRLNTLRFAVSGQVRHVQFQSRAPAVYHGRCAEYCGLATRKCASSCSWTPPAIRRLGGKPSANPVASERERTSGAGRKDFCKRPLCHLHTIRGISKGKFGCNLTRLAGR
jgi:cytochrome c oxidase subunit II